MFAVTDATALQAPSTTSYRQNSHAPRGNALPRGLYSSSSDSEDDLGDALKRIRLKRKAQQGDPEDGEGSVLEASPSVGELQDDFEADELAGDPEADEFGYDPEAEQDNNQFADEFEDPEADEADNDEAEDDAEVGELEDDPEADESGFEEGDEDGDGDDAGPGAAADGKVSPHPILICCTPLTFTDEWYSSQDRKNASRSERKCANESPAVPMQVLRRRPRLPQKVHVSPKHRT